MCTECLLYISYWPVHWDHSDVPNKVHVLRGDRLLENTVHPGESNVKKLKQERDWKVRRRELRKKGPFQIGWLWKASLNAMS